MGLFDDNDDKPGSTLNDLVDEVKDQMDQDSGESSRRAQDHSSTPNSSNESAGERSSTPNTRLVEDARQWEYEVLPLDDDEAMISSSLADRISEKGLIEGVEDQVWSKTVGPGLPPIEVLNELGREGWELVDTVERASLKGAEGGGSYTYALLFRRPVEYVEEDSSESAE